jgi:hypothetical protein
MISEASVDAILPAQGWLRRYVEWARGCIDAHILYHVGVGLSILAQSTPPELSGPFGVDVKTNLYVMLVGESGESRKTISIEIGRDQVLRPSQICELGEAPGSHEMLIDSLIAQPKMLIIYPELGAFLAACERGYLQPIKTAYCEAFDNSPLARPTVTGKKAKPGVATRVEDPRLSLLCAVSQPLLERHTDSADWCGGFLSRFLMFVTTRERESFEFTTNKAGAKALAEELMIMNAARAKALDLTTGKPNTWGPCLGFDASAKLLWRSWRMQVNERLKKAPLEIRGGLSRAATQALKIGLILGWDYGGARKSANPWTIGEAELAPALSLVNFHMDSVTEIGGYMALTPTMRERRTILQIIRGPQWPKAGPPVHISEIITKSNLLKRRVDEHVVSLQAEWLVVAASSGAGEAYLPTSPEIERERMGRMLVLPGATQPSGPAQVINLDARRPRPEAAPAPVVTAPAPVGSTPVPPRLPTFTGESRPDEEG